jgi:hypothetical protein
MTENRVVALRQRGAIDDPLTEILRTGARRSIAQVVEAEFETFIQAAFDFRLPAVGRWDADLTLTDRPRTNIEHAPSDPRGQLTTCGRRPPSSLCAPRFGKSKASTGAQHRRCPSVLQRWTLDVRVGRCRSAHCMRSLAAATARSTARPPRFLPQGSPPARAAKCSGVSIDWICLRRRSRKPG